MCPVSAACCYVCLPCVPSSFKSRCDSWPSCQAVRGPPAARSIDLGQRKRRARKNNLDLLFLPTARATLSRARHVARERTASPETRALEPRAHRDVLEGPPRRAPEARSWRLWTSPSQAQARACADPCADCASRRHAAVQKWQRRQRGAQTPWPRGIARRADDDVAASTRAAAVPRGARASPSGAVIRIPSYRSTTMPLYFKSSRIALGSSHPDTLGSICNYATLLVACKRFDEAGALMREALESCRRVHTSIHLSTLQATTSRACSVSLAALTGRGCSTARPSPAARAPRVSPACVCGCGGHVGGSGRLRRRGE